jgi:hypothetical protein
MIKSRYKYSLIIALSIAHATQVYSYQEEAIGQEIIAELQEQPTQKDIDAELYDLFKKFFNDHDDMPFFQFVTKVITVLKAQKALLSGQLHLKCDEMITTFEKNKDSAAFHIWAPILAAPDLRAIMSQDTRDYINSISTQTKIRALMNKLRK